MSALPVISWSGYDFTCHDPELTNWNDVPGVYIFAGVSSDGRWWQAKYIGQTRSFRDRLNAHERWGEASRMGATHIHASVVEQEFRRSAIEGYLISAYSPPMNTKA